MSDGDLPYKMRTSRRPMQFVEKEVDEHIRHVGEITFAWTQLQAALFAIFYALLRREHKLAHGIWHSIRNDSAQRDMLLAAAEAKLSKKHKSVLNQIKWIVDCTSALSTHRNDLTHTPLALDYDGDAGVTYTIPDFVSGREASVTRLRQHNDRSQWRKVSGDLRALESYARYIGVRIMGGVNRPISGSWPRRPKLQSLVATKGSGRPRLRPHTPKVPPPQRQSWIGLLSEVPVPPKKPPR